MGKLLTSFRWCKNSVSLLGKDYSSSAARAIQAHWNPVMFVISFFFLGQEDTYTLAKRVAMKEIAGF